MASDSQATTIKTTADSQIRTMPNMVSFAPQYMPDLRRTAYAQMLRIRRSPVQSHPNA